MLLFGLVDLQMDLWRCGTCSVVARYYTENYFHCGLSHDRCNSFLSFSVGKWHFISLQKRKFKL